MFLNAPGSIAFSQEHFKTITYAKFGGQTECITGNWKIVNGTKTTGSEKEPIIFVPLQILTLFAGPHKKDI